MLIEWNTHRIAARRHRQGVAGIPDVLFLMPEQQDAQSYHAGICEQDLITVETELELAGGEPDVYDQDFLNIVNLVLSQWEKPTTCTEAQTLYVDILASIEQMQEHH